MTGKDGFDRIDRKLPAEALNPSEDSFLVDNIERKSGLKGLVSILFGLFENTAIFGT